MTGNRVSRIVEGKVRKYYKITPKDMQILEEARQKIKEPLDEVMLG